MEGIQDMLQMAAKMKGAQTAQDRRKFDSWPPYLQETLFASESEELRTARETSLQERIAAASALQADAKALYLSAARAGDDSSDDEAGAGAGDGSDVGMPGAPRKLVLVNKALMKYKQALGMFIYITSSKPWRKGIKDEDLTKHVKTGDPASAEGQRATALMLALYNNIAACHMELSQHAVAVRACGDALRIDPTNARALFRRARARLASASAGATELDASIADLQTAIRAHPDDEAIAAELRKLKGRRKRQRQLDKQTFGGLFDRGQVVAGKGAARQSGSKSGAGSGAGAGAGAGTGAGAGAGAGPKTSAEQFEFQVRDLERVAAQWEKDGKTEEARELRQHLATVKRQRDQEMSAPDFANPTPQMKAEAAKHGIDLDDPDVRAELAALVEERGPLELMGTSAEKRPSKKAAKSKPGKDAPGLSLEDIASRVDTMPRAGLIAILKTEPNTDESSLEALSLAKLRKRAKELLKRAANEDAKRASRATTIKYVAMGAAFLFMFWRLTNTGMTNWMVDWAKQLVFGAPATDEQDFYGGSDGYGGAEDDMYGDWENDL